MASGTPSEGTRPIQSSERSWQPVLTSKNLSIVVAGAVVIVALLKADPKDIPRILDNLFASNVWAITGWIIASVVLVASVVMIKLLIRFYDNEMKRLAKERDDLQSLLINRSRD